MNLFIFNQTFIHYNKNEKRSKGNKQTNKKKKSINNRFSNVQQQPMNNKRYNQIYEAERSQSDKKKKRSKKPIRKKQINPTNS